MCEYEFRNGKRCKEEALPNSKYCILHIDLPEDEESEEFKRINKLKEEKVKEKINEGDFNFEGAKLLKIDFSKMVIEGNVYFYDVVIIKGATFEGVKIKRSVWFDGAEIKGIVSFREAKIEGAIWFIRAKIWKGVEFGGAIIKDAILLNEATIGDIGLRGAKICGNGYFLRAKISGNVWVDTLEITGKLTFENAMFKKMGAQEWACRKAKATFEELGDRGRVDYHFYREMEAKRKQKNPVIRLLELPVQYIFGYGVHSWRVIATWFLTAFSLAFVYWLGNGVEAADSLVEYIYFSVVTAATPGYGGYHPNPDFIKDWQASKPFLELSCGLHLLQRSQGSI